CRSRSSQRLGKRINRRSGIFAESRKEYFTFQSANCFVCAGDSTFLPAKSGAWTDAGSHFTGPLRLSFKSLFLWRRLVLGSPLLNTFVAVMGADVTGIDLKISTEIDNRTDIGTWTRGAIARAKHRESQVLFR